MLEVTKEIYGLSNRDFNKNLNELTKYISDPTLLDALIYKPKIVMLDESLVDLDSIYEYNDKSQATTLIIAEKVDSLVDLVRRVIILDEGQVLFDGAIDEVIGKNATEKLIKAKLSSEIDLKVVEEIGTVKKYVYPNLHISAPRSTVMLAAAEMLQNLPITSLFIEELPIEEIIHNIKK
jgi:ABC-2 type transport system ATP-binding protein